MGPLGITSGHDSLNCWQILSVEFVLTFVVVFTTYATLDSNRKSFGSDSLAIGLAYLVTSLTGVSLSGVWSEHRFTISNHREPLHSNVPQFN